jgi:glutamate/aspartate transport system substrate-binding protein
LCRLRVPPRPRRSPGTARRYSLRILPSSLVRFRVLLLASALLAGVTAATAQPSMTLRRIEQAGVVSIGYRDASFPFSYLDEQQRPAGYSIDLCRHVVEAARRRLGLRDIETRWVAVNAATRIPLVVNGIVDLECGSTTNTAERQRQVAFSVTMFVTATRLLSRKSAPVDRLEDLRGGAVVSTVGTTNLKIMQDLNQRSSVEFKVLAVGDDNEAFHMVETERARAYAMDDVLLHGLIATSAHPGAFMVSSETLSVEPYGLMLRKGDPVFKALVDETLTALYRSGGIDAIYRRWFLSPIPPRGANLELPVSPVLQRVFRQPTDSPDPAAYR